MMLNSACFCQWYLFRVGGASKAGSLELGAGSVLKLRSCVNMARLH